jgi:hypothetical protein
LLDGITLVVRGGAAPSPFSVTPRRLVARARERSAVLVALGDWPVEAAVRVHTGPAGGAGSARGAGCWKPRDLNVSVEAKGRGFARAG